MVSDVFGPGGSNRGGGILSTRWSVPRKRGAAGFERHARCLLMDDSGLE